MPPALAGTTRERNRHPPMNKPLSIPAKAYARRRKQLMRMAGDDAILVLPAALERIRSRDTHYPYRQDSDLLYLTGFPEPEAVLVHVAFDGWSETFSYERWQRCAAQALADDGVDLAWYTTRERGYGEVHNEGGAHHDFTVDHARFSTGDIAPGNVIHGRFTVPDGRTPFHCRYHHGMTGTIVGTS